MSNYYGNDDELRSITFRDDEGVDSYYGRSRSGSSRHADYEQDGNRAGRGDRTDYYHHPEDQPHQGGGRRQAATEYFDEYGRRRQDPAPDTGRRGHGDPDDDFELFGQYEGYPPSRDPYRPGRREGYRELYRDEAVPNDPYRGNGQYGDPYGREGYPDDRYSDGRYQDARYPDDYRDDYRDAYGQDPYGRDPYGRDPYADDRYRRYDDPYDDPYAEQGARGEGAGFPPYGRGAGPGDDGDGRRPRRNKTKTALLVMLSLLLMLGGGLVLTAYLWSESIGNKADRVDAFGDLKNRPEKAANDSMNFLLAGTDAARDGQKTTGAGQEGASGRADSIMIVHLSADREHAYLISIPRDTYVDVPGYGMQKINASFALGGPSLYIETVEKLTGLRMDHYAAIDWEGFKALTDALGGVQMTFEEDTILAGGDTVPPGTHTLDGETALAYVRERKNLEGGDFDRAKRQQNFMRSLMTQTLSSGTLTNPGKLSGALNAVVENLEVDNEFSNNVMRSLALEMKNVRANDVEFMTIPLADPPTAMVDGQSIVQHDEERAASLFDAVRHDKTEQWLKKNEADTLEDEENVN